MILRNFGLNLILLVFLAYVGTLIWQWPYKMLNISYLCYSFPQNWLETLVRPRGSVIMVADFV